MLLKRFWGSIARQDSRATEQPAAQLLVNRAQPVAGPTIEIAPDDPLIPYLTSAGGAVEVDRINLDSPALDQLRTANVKLIVPLVSQGELVGMLNLGSRLSEQVYSIDDRALLNNLAAQATPAVRVAQLVRQQQAELQTRERMEHELSVARLIQQTLLPKKLPELPGWQIAVHYQPARAVGGDFYDFMPLPDGRLVLAVGDVTDKGVPAALVMATTRSILRGAARRKLSPSAALVRANELLCPEVPPSMFVTCLYAVLDPASGRLRYANAGHDLPYWRHGGRADELHATGMPLGLMPGMDYEEKEIVLSPGESILLYSDGLVEAHNPQQEMFGFPRLRQCVADQPLRGAALIHFLLSALKSFTGPDWEQEDDITMVTLERTGSTTTSSSHAAGGQDERDTTWRRLTFFSVPSVPGNEIKATKQIAKAVHGLNLAELRREQLKTAVAETVMNAIEHGNQNLADMPVSIEALTRQGKLCLRITDHGGTHPIPEPQAPDLAAKLAGQQSPRGWGLFLIRNMVDEMNVTNDDAYHTVELVFYLDGGQDAGKSV